MENSHEESSPLSQFQDRFGSEEQCSKYLIKRRWPDGFVCPHCQSRRSCFKPSRNRFECYNCKKVTSPTSGTMFHRTKIPLQKWFRAILLVFTAKKKISALFLEKELDVSYPTAWGMLRKIRLLMENRQGEWNYVQRATAGIDEIFSEETWTTPFFQEMDGKETRRGEGGRID